MLLSVLEGPWAADVGSVAVADSWEGKKQAWYGTKLTGNVFQYLMY